jgi:hypothetical protein
MSCGGPAAQGTGPSLAQVLALALEQAALSLPTYQWRILRVLRRCRTRANGGRRYRCADCGLTHFVPRSCGNRHCPLCQGQAARQWLEQQQQALLPVPYFHLVFTLPHLLNPLIQQNQRALYTLLFQAVSQTLLQFGQKRFGVQLGITAVLHTWSQTLLDHYHLHCIVTGGGLSSDGARWVSTPPNYLFAVRALSKVYRAKFLAGLQALYAKSKLEFHGQLAGLAAPGRFARLLRRAARLKWVVYANRPFGGPRQVLAYLSRYTHRVAITPRRLLALDVEAQRLTFAWKDYADDHKQKTMTLPVREFLRRFCLHLLPQRFVKIRHYGLLGNRRRHALVPRARELLAQRGISLPVLPDINPPPPARVCPYCGSDKLEFIEIVEPGQPAILDSS